MKKKVLLLVMASFLIAGVVSAASLWGNYKGNQIIRLTVDGDPVKVSDVPAISYQGRTMIPIYLLQQAGVQYSWDGANQTVNITKSKKDMNYANAYAILNEKLLKILSVANLTYQQMLLNDMVFNAYSENIAINVSDNELLAASDAQVDAIKAIAPNQVFRDSVRPLDTNFLVEISTLLTDVSVALESSTSGLIEYKKSRTTGDYDGAIKYLDQYTSNARKINSLMPQLRSKISTYQTWSSQGLMNEIKQ